MQLNINTDATVVMTNNLEKLHRSAFPNAVRETLNRAALDVKKDTLLKSADKNFIKREPNFFKANSRVEFARGYNVNSMAATVGMVEKNLKGEHNNSVKDLEQQEEGGNIGGRSFLPLYKARVGNNPNKKVKANLRISDIRKSWNSRVVDVRKQNAKNKKEAFVKAAIKAGAGGFVFSDTYFGSRILFRIDSVFSSLKGRKTIIRKTGIYSAVKGFKAKVKNTHFMKNAALESGSKIERFYNEEGQKQVERLMNK